MRTATTARPLRRSGPRRREPARLCVGQGKLASARELGSAGSSYSDSPRSRQDPFTVCVDLRVGSKVYGAAMASFRISQLADRVGVPATTLRFYETAGLLAAERTPTGCRMYGEEAVERLAFIFSGKLLGLSLEEIGDLSSVWEQGVCAAVRERMLPPIAARIADADQRAAELSAFSARLAAFHAELGQAAPAGGCGPDCGCLTTASSVPAGPVSLTLSPVRPDVTAAEVWPDVPAACTLGVDEQTDRAAQWRALLEEAVGREEIADGLRLTFHLARTSPRGSPRSPWLSRTAVRSSPSALISCLRRLSSPCAPRRPPPACSPTCSAQPHDRVDRPSASVVHDRRLGRRDCCVCAVLRWATARDAWWRRRGGDRRRCVGAPAGGRGRRRVCWSRRGPPSPPRGLPDRRWTGRPGRPPRPPGCGEDRRVVNGAARVAGGAVPVSCEDDRTDRADERVEDPDGVPGTRRPGSREWNAVRSRCTLSRWPRRGRRSRGTGVGSELRHTDKLNEKLRAPPWPTGDQALMTPSHGAVPVRPATRGRTRRGSPARAAEGWPGSRLPRSHRVSPSASLSQNAPP